MRHATQFTLQRSVRLIAQLAVIFALAIGASETASAQAESLVCQPDRPCIKACRVKARTAFNECVRAGHPMDQCRERADELRRACIESECHPVPTCEDRCKRHGKKLLRRCLEDGGDLDRCREHAEKATRTCIEEHCRDCNCPDVYDPVCGADGMTYGNKCEAACARVPVVHEGPCEPKCDPLPCDVFCEHGHVLDPNGCKTCECKPPPGCESDRDCEEGESCREICSARPCREGEVDCPECFGICVPTPDPPCVCPEIYDPVCGMDGRTYSNDCFARCADVGVAHDGECRDKCRNNMDCDRGEVCHPRTNQCQPACQIQCFRADPVCGEDNITYVCGEEDAFCHGVDVKHRGMCAQLSTTVQ